MATVAARSVMRLTVETSRIAAIRISAGVKTKAAPSPFRVSSRTPLTARIFRTPVELSGVSLVSMLPYHTATASALLKSKLSVAHGHAWTLEALLSQKYRKFFAVGKERTRYEGPEKAVVKPPKMYMPINELPSIKLSLLNARGSLPLKDCKDDV